MRRAGNVYSILIIFSFVYLLGCSPEEDPEKNLIGMWTVTEFKVGIVVNGVSIIDWHQLKYGSTEAEANEFANIFVEELEEGFKGTMEFRIDHTYSANLGGEPEETGTWLLTDDNQKLTFTNAASNESNESDIKVLSSSLLVLVFSDTDRGDIDQDSRNENIFLSIELSFEK